MTVTRASRTGCLLINVGTPDAPHPGPVRTYLREFLGDPRVLDLPALGRWALLNLVILPVRPRKSAEAYRAIWTEHGSPLLRHSHDLVAGVRAALGPDVPVELGMRYGTPSIAQALDKLKAAGADRLVVLPLYPQYAASSTGSALEEVYRAVGNRWTVPSLDVIEPFYEHPAFLDAFAHVARPVLETMQPDHLLFSFHGLPERQVQRCDETGRHCLATPGCCDALVEANRHCYRAQSFHTARMLAERLSLAPDAYSVSFQSRLGRTPWIKPYTDLVLPELVKAGKKRVAVMCPAFTADCLETLEEIGIRARRDFVAQGGEDLQLIPSLNAHPTWVEGVAGMLRGRLGAAR